MEESYIKEFVKMKAFKQNPNVRKVFRKTKFKDLMKSQKVNTKIWLHRLLIKCK